MDLIERQAAIDICQKRLLETALNNVDISSIDISSIYVDIADNRIANWLSEPPSVQPPTGTWEEKEILSPEDSKAIEQWQSAKCSVCGHYHTIPYLYSFHESNFCPHCGARNGGEQNDDHN